MLLVLINGAVFPVRMPAFQVLGGGRDAKSPRIISNFPAYLQRLSDRLIEEEPNDQSWHIDYFVRTLLQAHRNILFFYATNRPTFNDVVNTDLDSILSREVIESHDGTISFESTINSGSVFTLSLPIPPSNKKPKVE